MKTRAALFTEPGSPMTLASITVDEPGPHDVLVRVAAAGVCGSDLHVVRGEWKRPTPMILGHEGAGVVERVGDAVSDLEVGDRVILSWAPACHACGPCRRGRPASCSRLRAAIAAGTLIDGTTRLHHEGGPVYRMTTVGAYAEHVLVPEHGAIRVPPEVSLDDAALIGCAALTGVGAVWNVTPQAPGARAAVIGAGGVGQFVVQGLRIAGAELIAAVDPVPQRREQALALGATHALAPDELTEFAGTLDEGFDYAYDVVGGIETAAAAIAAIRTGGTAVLVGMGPPGMLLGVDPLEFVTREKTLVGSIYGSGDPAQMTERLLEHVAAGDLLLAPMIGERFGLEQIDDAVAAALDGRAGRTLVILDQPSAT